MDETTGEIVAQFSEKFKRFLLNSQCQRNSHKITNIAEKTLPHATGITLNIDS